MPKKPNEYDYYDNANDWNYDAYESVVVSRDRWFLLTVLSVGAVVLAGLGIYQYLPLKTVVPVVIVNNQTTGDIKVVDQDDNAQFTTNKANVEKHISDYLRYREGYNYHTIETWFEYVQDMSVKDVSKDYIQLAKHSTNSPLKRLGQDGTITMEIDTIATLNDSSVLVDFILKEKINKNSKAKIYYYRAVIDYVWSGLQVNTKFKGFNPFGFKVTSYRKDQKNITPIFQE